MSQTTWLVALSAVAVVSAVLSFVAWSLLARSPASLPPTAEPEDESAEGGDEAVEHEEEDPEAD